MMVELTTKSLQIPGVLKVTDNVANLAPDQSATLLQSHDISNVISPQFDRLTIRFQSLLKIAAVAGALFNVDGCCMQINRSTSVGFNFRLSFLVDLLKATSSPLKPEESFHGKRLSKALIQPSSQSEDSGYCLNVHYPNAMSLTEDILEKVIEEDDKYRFLVKVVNSDGTLSCSFRHAYIQQVLTIRISGS
jgi:hypothetical protein